MIDKRTAVLIALVGVGLMLSAVAASAVSSFGEGGYTLALPGVGEFEFFVDSDGSDVEAVDAPSGFEESDATAALSWKPGSLAAGPGVEINPDVIEAGVKWIEGPVTLSLPEGSITITEPYEDGAFSVIADGEWWAFGGGADWYVADNESIRLARSFFKIEANSHGVKIRAVKEADPAFLRSLDQENDGHKGQGKGRPDDAGKNQGKSEGKGRGDA